MADANSFFNIYSAGNSQDTRNKFWLVRLLQTLLGILLMTLIINLGIVFFYPDGLQLLKNTYNSEVQYLNASIGLNASNFITLWVNTAYEWIFIKTGIHRYFHTGGSGQASSIVAGLWPIMQGVMIGLQIFMIRLSIIVLMLPFVCLAMFVCASDGYLAWYKRRTGGDRESGFIYHRSKKVLSWSLIGLWIIYLIPPIAIDPSFVFVPSILLGGMSTKLSIQYFKKYI
jgi:integrating conjugative element membrane protein (TIGR03747 family)